MNIESLYLMLNQWIPYYINKKFLYLYPAKWQAYELKLGLFIYIKQSSDCFMGEKYIVMEPL